MPRTLTTTVSASDGTDKYVTTVSVTADGRVEKSPAVPPAKPGVLTTRTDADTGTATMDAGHGFASGSKPDVFWATGSRRGMTATVTGSSVVLDGGAGDSLPASGTAITAMIPQSEEFVVTGDNVVGIVAGCPKAGWVTFAQADGTVIAAYQLDAANDKSWISGSGVTSPLAGAVVGKVLLSHADATAAKTVSVAAFVN